MSELINKQPIDLLYEALTDFEPGTLTSDQLVNCVELRYGHSIRGFVRADLENLAAQEIDHDTQIYQETEI
jgi:hypothetical protein